MGLNTEHVEWKLAGWSWARNNKKGEQSQVNTNLIAFEGAFPAEKVERTVEAEVIGKSHPSDKDCDAPSEQNKTFRTRLSK